MTQLKIFLKTTQLVHINFNPLTLRLVVTLVGALSSGIAAVKYSSIEPMVLSFNVGDEITIYSKDAGKNRELWGAEVRFLVYIQNK